MNTTTNGMMERARTLLCSATPSKVLDEKQSREWCESFGKWLGEANALIESNRPTTPTTDQPKHTAIPWHFEAPHFICATVLRGGTQERTQICTLSTDWKNGLDAEPLNIRNANAHFICTAVNAHQELVEALKAMVDAHGKLPSWPPTEYADRVTKQATALLSKIGGANE